MSTYLWVNLFAVSLPLLLSFEPRFSFYKKFAAVITAVLPVAAFFSIWDIWFTNMEVWGFNPLHLSGVTLLNLPVEEWLFFITIPFASLFTYEVVNYHFSRDYLGKAAKPILLSLAFVLVVVGILYIDKWYTAVTFLLTGAYLLFNIFILKARYLGQFIFAYLLILIPFLIVNGILTGSYIPEEVVYYNNAENLGIRIFTIPIEDSVYGLLLILMNINLFEWALQRRGQTYPRYSA